MTTENLVDVDVETLGGGNIDLLKKVIDTLQARVDGESLNDDHWVVSRSTSEDGRAEYFLNSCSGC